MKGYVGKRALAVLFVTMLSVGTMSGALDVWAQEGDSLAKQIVGAWILVSMVNEQDGKKTEPFGPNPRGIHVYSPDGRFYAITMRASLPKFASNNRMKGTAEEYQAVVQGSNAYFGTYKVVNEKEHLVGLHVEASTFANWDGQDHTRVITVVGDQMKVTTPTTSVGGTSYAILKRAK